MGIVSVERKGTVLLCIKHKRTVPLCSFTRIEVTVQSAPRIYCEVRGTKAQPPRDAFGVAS